MNWGTRKRSKRAIWQICTSHKRDTCVKRGCVQFHQCFFPITVPRNTSFNWAIWQKKQGVIKLRRIKCIYTHTHTICSLVWVSWKTTTLYPRGPLVTKAIHLPLTKSSHTSSLTVQCTVTRLSFYLWCNPNLYRFQQKKKNKTGGLQQEVQKHIFYLPYFPLRGNNALCI